MSRWYRCSWCDELDEGAHVCKVTTCERCGGALGPGQATIRLRRFCCRCAIAIEDTITTNQIYSEQVLRMKGLL